MLHFRSKRASFWMPHVIGVSKLSSLASSSVREQRTWADQAGAQQLLGLWGGLPVYVEVALAVHVEQGVPRVVAVQHELDDPVGAPAEEDVQAPAAASVWYEARLDAMLCSPVRGNSRGPSLMLRSWLLLPTGSWLGGHDPSCHAEVSCCGCSWSGVLLPPWCHALCPSLRGNTIAGVHSCPDAATPSQMHGTRTQAAS